jgi:hypothetical protein
MAYKVLPCHAQPAKAYRDSRSAGVKPTHEDGPRCAMKCGFGKLGGCMKRSVLTATGNSNIDITVYTLVC